MSLRALSEYLSQRRPAILQAWHEDALRDPSQPSASSLTRAQFTDHIPQVLDAFEALLSADVTGATGEAIRQTRREEVKHGLQRWQQGYKLSEVVYEWGHLHLCLFHEIQRFAHEHPEFSGDLIARAQRALIHLVTEGIGESAGQFARMQEKEAAGLAVDLQSAVTELRESERRRTGLIRQVVHDLRGNVQSVSATAEVLGDSSLEAADRLELAALLQEGVTGVSKMLEELMELARLEAGQQRVDAAAFDAGKLIKDFCRATQPMALAAGLYLNLDGASPLEVVGDAAKVRRILQNLVHNAVKYTKKGGVEVTWGQEDGHWWLKVKDTGPGLLAGPVAPITLALEKATDNARESLAAAEHPEPGESVLAAPPPSTTASRPHGTQPSGEGIGLSIVKRICELLDASIEMTSSAEGTIFRIVFPSGPRPPT